MTQEEQQFLKECRKEIFLTSCRRGLTHLASAFSCLEILYALYMKGVLRVDPSAPDREDRDRFILSKGHAAIALYAMLERAGFLAQGELDTFLTEGTRLAGEPCRRDLPCLEASAGSLGHGLSLGIGMALAQRMEQTNSRTFVLLGDGECQEGSVWEAAFSAAAHRLGNLVAILDCNGLQKMSSTGQTMGHVEWKNKWEAFGWQVAEADGHDVDELCGVLGRAGTGQKPLLVIAHTVKGKGVSIMENDVRWHYKVPKEKEIRKIAQELGATEEELASCREHI